MARVIILGLLKVLSRTVRLGWTGSTILVRITHYPLVSAFFCSPYEVARLIIPRSHSFLHWVVLVVNRLAGYDELLCHSF